MGTTTTYGSEPALQIHQRGDHVLPLDPAYPRLRILARLPHRPGLGDPLLVLVQEPRLLGGVGQEEPGHARHDQRRRALDEEEQPPPRDGRALGGGDAVRERAGEGVGERRGRQEDALPRADFVPQVEEGQQVRDARAVAGFEDAHQEAQRHHALPVVRRGLHRGDETPRVEMC